MKLFRRSKPAEAGRRHVAGLGRTNAFAYHANRLDEEASLGRHVFREALEERVKKKQTRQLLQRAALALVLVAIVVGTASLLGLSTDPMVLPVDETQASLLRPLATYQQAARVVLSGSLFNHNKITVDTAAVSAALKKQFPELSVVYVSLPVIGRQPTIYVAPADPVLALTTLDNHTYVISSTGRAMGGSTPALATRLHLLLTKDLSGTPITLGQPVLASSSMSFIQTVLYQLHQKHIIISMLVLPAASGEADFYISGQPYYGKFNLATDTALEQAGTFLATKHYLEGKGLTPQAYIDVRVAGRAYYK